MVDSILSQQVSSVILAGGQGKRMRGVDKGLLQIDGCPLIESICCGLKPQVANIMISANRHQDQYAHYGHRVLSDFHTDFQGPLAGIEAAFAVMDTPYLLTYPCDVPQVPADLVTRLLQGIMRHQASAAYVVWGEQKMPVISLLHYSLKESLSQFIDSGERGVFHWLKGQNAIPVNWSDDYDGFQGANTPQELERLQLLRRSG